MRQSRPAGRGLFAVVWVRVVTSRFVIGSGAQAAVLDRLLEIDCKLPEVARAWAHLSSLGLSNTEELSLLASVGNEYCTSKLQKAAVLHEKSLKPAQAKTGKPGNVRGTYLTGVEEDDDPSPPAAESVYPEETAQALHEAYVAQETAKTRYREVAKSRGVDCE